MVTTRARRVTLSLFTSISILSATVAACGGGGEPKIKSFAASSSNVPLPGGDVTFTWSVKGEETLELRPYPGAVSGTGITISVTESTEFTLVAKSNGRTDRESLYVGVGDPFTVNGRVMSQNGAPASNTIVYTQGKSAVTDGVGNFTLEGVVAPYDLAVMDPNLTNNIVVYSGLTRVDPTVTLLLASSEYSTTMSGTIGGVPFPTPTPPPASATWIRVFVPQGFTSQTSPDPNNGTYFMGTSWAGSEEATAKVTTMRWNVDDNGVANVFPGFARSTETVENGVPLVHNPALAPVGALSLSGSVTTEVDMSTPAARAGVDFGGPEAVPQSSITLNALVDVFELPYATVTTASSFTRYVPDVGASYALVVSASEPPSGNAMTVTRRGLAGGATGVEIHVPQPPRMLIPVANAVLTSATQFAIAAPDDSIRFLYFQVFTNNGSFSIYWLTDDEQMSFPSLDGLGVPFDAVQSGFWSAQSIGPFESIDEFAGPNAGRPVGDTIYNGLASGSRGFSKSGGPIFP